MHSKFLLTLALSFVVLSARADDVALPFVSPMFGSHMVLQRGKANTIWGWAKAGEEIRVEIAGHTAATKADAKGRWQVEFQPPATGGPYVLKIDGPQHVEFSDILVGDVWLCGGQSNMEMGLGQVQNGAEEIKSADHPNIRLFLVNHQISYSPAPVSQGSWKVCSPQTVGSEGWDGFSAIGYFFGRKVQADIKVPIGLVEDCVGGTPAESWISAEALHKLKHFAEPLAEVQKLKEKGGPAYGNYIMSWYDEYDAGIKGKTWAAADVDDSSWKNVTIPGGFKELGVADVPSVCWFRKEITLPDPLPAGKATLYLGVIERMDTAYVNGQWVGASAWVENPRVYDVKHSILKPGKNVVTIRVFKTKPQGGFMSKPDDLRLTLGDTTVSLAGEWKGKLSVDARAPHPMPLGFENWPVMPSVLYEGMLAPVAPLAITGAIWYQGEANAERAHQYQTLLPAMIADWRKLFHQGDFPFYIVGLPAFMQRQNQPGESSWAEMREAQAIVAKNVKNTAVSISINTGEANNIHPKDKKEVGEHLAAVALAKHYGEKIPFQGPTFTRAETISGAMKLHFDHTDGGLVVKGDKLGEFSVAGEDHKWHWAEAKIEGDSIIVSSSSVAKPVAVRYAWQSNPAATLFNGAGFPAAPFRTDDWPGITQNHKPW